jgi:hypothetical protein
VPLLSINAWSSVLFKPTSHQYSHALALSTAIRWSMTAAQSRALVILVLKPDWQKFGPKPAPHEVSVSQYFFPAGQPEG